MTDLVDVGTVLDFGNTLEVFAITLVRVERVGRSSVQLTFANPRNHSGENCQVVNFRLIVEAAAVPDIIRALQNLDSVGTMSSDAPEGRRMHS
ncbi:MAG: hypothetical protein GEU95_21670 [Rhizobiales bacterium]|nr:hypothetical protein [Hyphomicrobiales bacterium]